jgi:hypothetical protein
MASRIPQMVSRFSAQMKQVPTSFQDIRQKFKNLTYLQKFMIGTGAVTTYVVGRFGYTRYTDHLYWSQQKHVIKGQNETVKKQNEILHTQKEILKEIQALKKGHSK